LFPDNNQFAQTLLWLIANLGTENDLSIQSSIICSKLFNYININTKNISTSIKKEAVWALTNLITGADLELAGTIISLDGMNSLIQVMMYETNPDILQISLEGIKNLLKLGDDFSELNNLKNPIKVKFEELGGNIALENLLKHPHKCVYNEAKELLNKYFGELFMNEDNYFDNI